jgi:PIN domain nuclease of toxin-antitoxin system
MTSPLREGSRRLTRGRLVLAGLRSLVRPRTQTTRKLTEVHLAGLRSVLLSSTAFTLHLIDLAVVDATTSIARDLLADPWDRFLVGTASALALPLVTRDEAIHDAQIVPVIW